MLSDEINGLPESVRAFIHDLEARCDPAGDVRRAHVAEENVAAMSQRIAELERELQCARDDMSDREERIVQMSQRNQQVERENAEQKRAGGERGALLERVVQLERENAELRARLADTERMMDRGIRNSVQHHRDKGYHAGLRQAAERLRAKAAELDDGTSILWHNEARALEREADQFAGEES